MAILLKLKTTAFVLVVLVFLMLGLRLRASTDPSTKAAGQSLPFTEDFTDTTLLEPDTFSK